jgi:hypothetical protein
MRHKNASSLDPVTDWQCPSEPLEISLLGLWQLQVDNKQWQAHSILLGFWASSD